MRGDWLEMVADDVEMGRQGGRRVGSVMMEDSTPMTSSDGATGRIILD